jgi:hypothetical protein
VKKPLKNYRDYFKKKKEAGRRKRDLQEILPEITAENKKNTE